MRAVIEYVEPGTVEEAVGFLASHRGAAKVVAGGQSLLVLLRQRLLEPEYLLGLDRIPGMRGIAEGAGGELVIGPLTTHREIAASPLVRKGWALLAEAAEQVGSPPVRNAGTIGGNLGFPMIGADPPAALVALGARISLAGPRGTRTVAVEEFYRGYMESVLEPDEIITQVALPPQPAGTRGTYLKYRLRGIDRALVAVAVTLTPDGRGSCKEIRIGLGGVRPAPVRALQAEAILRRARLTEETISRAAQAAVEEVEPVSDLSGSAEYRKKLVKVFVTRALRQLAAGGSGVGRVHES